MGEGGGNGHRFMPTLNCYLYKAFSTHSDALTIYQATLGDKHQKSADLCTIWGGTSTPERNTLKPCGCSISEAQSWGRTALTTGCRSGILNQDLTLFETRPTWYIP
jgi:hypothetical protein